MAKIKCLRVETERAAFLGDWHIPHHDTQAVELVFAFLAWFKPKHVFIIGDFLDFYVLSRFSKDPERLLELQSDLDMGYAILKRLRKTCPRAKIVYIDGNHEARLLAFLWNHPEISTLKSLRLPELLRLADFDIEHHSYHEQLQWHGLLIEHGDRVSKKSAYTAAAMVEARGISGVTGHTHRLGTHYRTDNSGVKVWAENGCLCRLDPSYVIGVPNWQHGFSVAQAMKGDERFFLEQIPIVKGKILYSGRLWTR